jgi:hypothetical protein
MSAEEHFRAENRAGDSANGRAEQDAAKARIVAAAAFGAIQFVAHEATDEETQRAAKHRAGDLLADRLLMG